MKDFEVILRDGNEERKVKEDAEESREMKIHTKLVCVSLVIIKKCEKMKSRKVSQGKRKCQVFRRINK